MAPRVKKYTQKNEHRALSAVYAGSSIRQASLKFRVSEASLQEKFSGKRARDSILCEEDDQITQIIIKSRQPAHRSDRIIIKPEEITFVEVQPAVKKIHPDMKMYNAGQKMAGLMLGPLEGRDLTPLYGVAQEFLDKKKRARRNDRSLATKRVKAEKICLTVNNSDEEGNHGEEKNWDDYLWKTEKMLQVLRNKTLGGDMYNLGSRGNGMGHNYAAQLCFMKDECFAARVGISRGAFETLLERVKISSQSQGQAKSVMSRGDRVPLRVRVLLTIVYLTSMRNYESITELFGYSLGSASRIVIKTVQQILAMAPAFLKWSSDPSSTAAEFQQLSGLEGVIGAVDTCHLVARTPGKVEGDYRNIYGKNTIVLLGVVDACKRFMYVSCGHPGRLTPQECLQSTDLLPSLSDIPNHFLPDDSVHLVGNQDFRLYQGMMVPYSSEEVLTPQQEAFNERLMVCQSLASDSFREVKSRFNSLFKLDINIERAVEFASVCCVLHNICIECGDSYVGQIITEEQQIQPRPGDINRWSFPPPHSQGAVAKRDAITACIR